MPIIRIFIYLIAFTATVVMDALGLVMVAIGILNLEPGAKHLHRFFYPWDNHEDGIDLAGR